MKSTESLNPKNNPQIRSIWQIQYEYDETDEEQVEEHLANAAGIVEDTLFQFFQKKGIKNITFSVDWNGDFDVPEGSLLREIGLQPPQKNAA